MANTYTLISSNTLTSSAASVTFSSIPATYTDLVLRISARATTGYGSAKITFNSDTATNYSNTALNANGATASSARDSSSVEAYAYYTINLSTYTASTFGNAEIYIPSYTASQNKPFGSFGVTENNSTTALMATTALLWRNTAVITSISLASSTSFDIGSSFYLYGIKNS